MRIAALSLVAVLALSDCGDKPPPDKAFILTDRSAIGFMTEFASGTYIGMSVQDHIAVMNKGLQDLSITDVAKTGDDAFTFSLEGQAMGAPPSSVLPITVKPMMSTFIEFIFTPTLVKRYSGAITITSNAENVKDLPIQLTGCGLRKNPDGGNPDQPDGGC
jgi:hypothetical protein